MSKSGFVSIIGRPNSGKSTLLNRVVGEKVSIVTDKPQTTRHVVRGIVTRPEGQITFLDTPGIHKPIHRMNERMMKSVRDAVSGVDLIMLIVDASIPFGRGDEFTLELLRPVSTRKFLLLNRLTVSRERTSFPRWIVTRSSVTLKRSCRFPLSAARTSKI
jgi:GTP-binding protein Era